MALNKLYYVYGLDTGCFYTDEECLIDKKLSRARNIKSLIKERTKSSDDEHTKLKAKHQISFLNQYIVKTKNKLKNTISNNVGLCRTVRNERILDKNNEPYLLRRVSIFDSTLTRCFGLKEREFNFEIIIVKVYYFDIAQSIVKNGFYLNGNKYVFFSSSAGQIRTKKLVAVREDLLNENWNRLTAGLSVQDINNQGGMNINKYLAYLALCNSATDQWEDFNIDKCVVVDDFENMVDGEVDFINEETYQIERQRRSLPFTHTDGVGMILPSLSKKNFMIRLPFVKGLLASFDFVKFIQQHNASPIVKDIYGKEHNIITEDIQIILTKSQFKMYKFYKDWDVYKNNFKKYNCQAGKCNVEEDVFTDSVINYQMIQTLADATNEEIMEMSEENNRDLINLATDYKTMLKVFGATKWNQNKSGFQKCLEKYPELLSDAYTRSTLKDIKVKEEKDLWSARLKINGKYTFVIPDLYAYCEWLFLHNENPVGLLSDGNVCCKLFENGEKLDCLRSPHLYCEHPIRMNRIDDKCSEWFNTNAIYVSCHDYISRIVQCDYDGDKLLVTNNQTLIKVAERNMKGIVPLFYNMRKAKAELLNPHSLYKGLLLAYNGGNIGTPSNNITKIWNSGAISSEQLNVIRWLTMEVNYIIDYAKTLYKPERPKWVDDIITRYTKSKVPNFFKYAKNKSINQVEYPTECTVDRIEQLYPTKTLNFNFSENNIGKFDYTVLMNNRDITYNQDVADNYIDITSSLNFNHTDDEKMSNYLATYEDAKNRILSFNSDMSEKDIVDNIIINLFSLRKTNQKKAFWFLFGDVVYENICKNLGTNLLFCQKCHKRFIRYDNANDCYCKKCSKKMAGRHKPIVIKDVTCVDCGNVFTISSESSRRKTRCEECYDIYRKKYKLENQQKQRNRKSQNMKTV